MTLTRKIFHTTQDLRLKKSQNYWMSESESDCDQVLWVPPAFLVVEKAVAQDNLHLRTASCVATPHSLPALDAAVKVYPRYLDWS